MANTEVINVIVTTVADLMRYLAPIIGILAGLHFVFSLLIHILFNTSRKF